MRTKLKKDERIIMVTRHHWLILFLPGLFSVIAAAAGILIGGYGLLTIPVAIIYFTYKYFERKFDIWVVTTQRVIDEFGFFSNNSKESPLDKINNVSYQQSLAGKLFGYGNVEIQTAAELGATSYNFMWKPRELKDNITNMQEEYKQEMIRRQANELAGAIASAPASGRTDVPAELEKLFDLKQRGIITEEEFRDRKIRLLNS
jgi:uncharacterized membrane protein YdbT with pleckstrin-like domain